jgi:hypothetical protein
MSAGECSLPSPYHEASPRAFYNGGRTFCFQTGNEAGFFLELNGFGGKSTAPARRVCARLSFDW